MVRKVSSKLWNTRLVVVSVLGVELYVAVAVQKHQLQSHEEKEMVNLKSMCRQKQRNKEFHGVWFVICGNFRALALREEQVNEDNNQLFMKILQR